MTYKPKDLEGHLIAYLEDKGVSYEISVGAHRIPQYSAKTIWVDVALYLPSVYTRMWTNVLRAEVEYIGRGYILHYETRKNGPRKMDVWIYAMKE